MLVEPGATKTAVPFSELDGRNAESRDGRRRSGRRVDAGGNRGGLRGVPARDDGEQDAARRRDGTRRDLGGLLQVERVLARTSARR